MKRWKEREREIIRNNYMNSELLNGITHTEKGLYFSLYLSLFPPPLSLSLSPFIRN